MPAPAAPESRPSDPAAQSPPERSGPRSPRSARRTARDGSAPSGPAWPRLVPAARTSLTEAVATQLASVIVEHELGPGARLPGERDLAQRLQVSRIVVREALGRLSQRGLVVVRPGVGTFVGSLPATSVTDAVRLYLRRHRVEHAHVFEVRDALEPAIAEAASRAGSTDHMARIADNLERTRALATNVAQGSVAVAAFAWADVEFHRLLAAATGNPLFELLLAPLIDRHVDVRREGARRPGTAARVLAGHAAVYAAVAAGDPAAAAARMAEHLQEDRSWSLGTAPGTRP
jgi:GntR family transcriptional regulator, transcriptional repressor for pyruvate dehydrogenase complex